MAVACAVLVLLVTMHLALCSLLASTGPRCSASWPVWTRRTVAVAFTWLVLLGIMHFPGSLALSWTPGAILGRGCVHARCWATTRPHGTDSAETRGVSHRCSRLPCCGAEASPHGLVDHGDCTVAAQKQGVRRSVVHVSRLQAWRRQSSSTVLTWRRWSRSHSAVLRSWIRLLTCPLICVYRCLTWSRQCRIRGVRRYSSWTRCWDGPDSAENCGVSALGADFRGSLLPGVMPPELGALVRVAGETPSCNTKVRTTTTSVAILAQAILAQVQTVEGEHSCVVHLARWLMV